LAKTSIYFVNWQSISNKHGVWNQSALDLREVSSYALAYLISGKLASLI